ncbi:hypothetical protein RO562_001681 [Salmonella enterica]|uniref:Uncharacterized protein n=8 Tax=Salmonella enterica TaxID=28901 RepID=A0A8E7NYT6_SALMU|nr:hypothetical protein [Salmonella enterica]EBV4258243.1 hypothetical protein [Salmonella enterica subsp. enterica serovar Braenderup]EHQ1799910.1 hypothetical protein [Salmonella enterica subsp. enterica serovar Hartford]PVQ55413.1 hypothetical protein C4691_20715 [Salmonella enterica subsp. enterica serovar Infantis]EAA5750643.1 hypothetical protein [Salmonella enterica]EAM3156051.1 hypothetical protein [Salmonella enterica]
MEGMAVLEVMEGEVAMAGTRLQDITEVMVVKVETAVVRVMVGEEGMVDMDNPCNNIPGWN